jgi:hypothetical protein
MKSIPLDISWANLSIVLSEDGEGKKSETGGYEVLVFNNFRSSEYKLR